MSTRGVGTACSLETRHSSYAVSSTPLIGWYPLVCKSTAEGGQRCSAHTREKMDLKSQAVEKAAAAGDMVALRAAQVEWEEAAAEYASTDKGHTHLAGQAEAALAGGDFDTSALLSTVVRRGEAMRAANQETAALIKAVRLSQAAVASPDRTMVRAINDELVEDTTSVVPDMSPVMRAEWAALVREFEDFEDFRSIATNCGTSYSQIYSSDMARYLDEIDAPIGSAESDDEALAKAVGSAGWVRGIKGQHPQWDRDRDYDHSEAGAEARQAREEAFSQYRDRLVSMMNVHIERGLKHPNAGAKTFDVAEKRGGLSSKALTGRPNAPIGYIKGAILSARSENDVHPDAWTRARADRFDDNSLALVLAVKDPDSFHRNEAFNQVMMTPLDTISKSDRVWLATNLHRFPGGPENQVVLAGSIKSWAMGYTDEKERFQLGSQMWNSKVPEVADIGAQLMGHNGGEKKSVATTGEKRRRWLSA